MDIYQFIPRNPTLTAKELELLARINPYIKAFLQASRRAKAAENKSDADETNAEMVQAFLYLCKHNLLFYLTIMNLDYDLERYFNPLFADKQAALVALREELLQQEKLHRLVTGQPPIIPIQPVIEKKIELIYALSSSPELMYFYLQIEVQRINYYYFVDKTVTHNHFFDSHSVLLTDVIKPLKASGVPAQEIAEIEARHQQFLARRKEIVDRPTVKEDGSLNVDAAQKKAKDMEELRVEFAKEIKTLLKKHQDKPGVAPYLQKLEQQEATLNKAIEERDKQHQEQLSEVKPYLHKAHEKILSKYNSRIETILEIVEACPKHALDGQQRSELDKAVKQLEDTERELAKVESAEQLQGILTKSKHAVETIETIVLPQLSVEEANKFHTAAQVFHPPLITLLEEQVKRETLVDDKEIQKEATNKSVPSSIEWQKGARNLLFQGREQQKSKEASHQLGPNSQEKLQTLVGNISDGLKPYKITQQVINEVEVCCKKLSETPFDKSHLPEFDKLLEKLDQLNNFSPDLKDELNEFKLKVEAQNVPNTMVQKKFKKLADDIADELESYKIKQQVVDEAQHCCDTLSKAGVGSDNLTTLQKLSQGLEQLDDFSSDLQDKLKLSIEVQNMEDQENSNSLAYK